MNNALDDLVTRADRALGAMHDASEKLTDLRLTRRSSNGLVVVTVDGAGALIGLELASDLSRTSAAELGATIVTTASEAAQEALEQRSSVLMRMQSSLSET